MSPLQSLLLHAYYYGGYPLRRRSRRQAAAQGRVPVVVLFYHRIADDRATSWTMSNRGFARQIALACPALRHRLARRGPAEDRQRPQRPALRARSRSTTATPRTAAAAVPLLIRERIPCTYFVTVENCLTGEPFPHDVALGHRFAPNGFPAAPGDGRRGHRDRRARLHPRRLRPHPDPDELERELAYSRDVLRRRIGRKLRYFAFPFGQYMNLSSAAFQMAREVGYEGVCSAYGGYNLPRRRRLSPAANPRRRGDDPTAKPHDRRSSADQHATFRLRIAPETIAGVGRKLPGTACMLLKPGVQKPRYTSRTVNESWTISRPPFRPGFASCGRHSESPKRGCPARRFSAKRWPATPGLISASIPT